MKVEVVAADDGAVIVLRHMLKLARAGRLSGVVVLAESVEGGYHATMTATPDAAKRVGLIDLLKDAVKASITDDEP